MAKKSDQNAFWNKKVTELKILCPGYPSVHVLIKVKLLGPKICTAVKKKKAQNAFLKMRM
jgi:hypothetical protein